MPIIYVHGVNTRDPKHFEPVKEYLREKIAPAISKDPDGVSIRSADWYQLCPPPKWEGISRPRTLLLGQGSVTTSTLETRTDAIAAIVEKLPKETNKPAGGTLTAGQTGGAGKTAARLEGLSDEELADLIALAAPKADATPLMRARIGIAADSVAHDPAIRARISQAASADEQLKFLADALRTEMQKDSGLLAAGSWWSDLYTDLRDRVSEGISRVKDAPLATVSVVAGEFRGPLNDLVTRFLGDVLYYLTLRGSAAEPGPIPKIVLDELETAQKNKEARDQEPIVVLTHSMGGQIVYDVVSTFLPHSEKGRGITVDFWCATASQIGFFEELGMFLASSKDYSKATGRRVPFPTANLGHWLNLWDHNDIISFTAKGIFDAVVDEEFKTGKWALPAHGGYLERPSMYRSFADKLREAYPGRGT